MAAVDDNYNIVLKWLQGWPERAVFEAPNIDYRASITFSDKSFVNWEGFNKTFVEFEIKLVRKYGRYVLETILPTGLLVIISWVRMIFFGSYQLLEIQKSDNYIVTYESNNWNHFFCRLVTQFRQTRFQVGLVYW